MRSTSVLVVAATALATCLGALALWGSVGRAVATEQDGPQARRPLLMADGVRLSLTPHQTTYQPGERPVLDLVAENTTPSPATVSVTVRMRVTELSSMVSRRLPAPSEGQGWQTTCHLALGPMETKTIVLPADVALKAGSVASLVVQVGEQAVAAGQLSVPRAAPRQQAQALSRQVSPLRR
ncbi:MAG: hypothetical protein ACLF0G_05245 [Candidatus Brocadiia bacterium]